MRIRILIVVTCVLVAAGVFAAGRWSAPARGYADGVRDGRAEQAVVGRPASDKAVFDAGYVAGAGDVFGGYDGGWDFGSPYVITLAPGSNDITYRIASRTPLQPGLDYSLCPDGRTLCSRPH